ncbi:MAG: hypothetical protein M0R17_03635 [Candidatus Omnitrophica bacterium]|jgi:hypothetical protein|nr:hypothetical protein [Candidatus Omnitrophota bacterium]
MDENIDSKILSLKALITQRKQMLTHLKQDGILSPSKLTNSGKWGHLEAQRRRAEIRSLYAELEKLLSLRDGK